MANRSPEARETLCFHGFSTEVKLGLVSRLINSFPFTPIFGFVAKRSAIVFFFNCALDTKARIPAEAPRSERSRNVVFVSFAEQTAILPVQIVTPRIVHQV